MLLETVSSLVGADGALIYCLCGIFVESVCGHLSCALPGCLEVSVVVTLADLNSFVEDVCLRGFDGNASGDYGVCVSSHFTRLTDMYPCIPWGFLFCLLISWLVELWLACAWTGGYGGVAVGECYG